jgi:hypothetical protein
MRLLGKDDSSTRESGSLWLRGKKRPVKPEEQVRVSLKTTSRAKRALVLTAALVGLAALILLLDVYFVRELLLFVGCAALLVFFAANLALLGILFHAAWLSLLESVRKAKPGIARQEEAHAERRVSPLTVSPPISTAARAGPL